MQISNVGVLRPLCSLERLPSREVCVYTCTACVCLHTVLHTILGSSVIIPLPPPCRETGMEREGTISWKKKNATKREGGRRGWPLSRRERKFYDRYRILPCSELSKLSSHRSVVLDKALSS